MGKVTFSPNYIELGRCMAYFCQNTPRTQSQPSIPSTLACVVSPWSGTDVLRCALKSMVPRPHPLRLTSGPLGLLCLYHLLWLA